MPVLFRSFPRYDFHINFLPLSRPPLALNTFATRAATPYPYPTQPNPTPHQIFHLPASASQKDIKQRYYELVKVHHPDSTTARELPPEVAQARFHSITQAYDVLRGRRPGMTIGESAEVEDRRTARDLNAAIWRARQRHKAELEFAIDDRWKDRVILGMVLLGVGGFVLQSWTTRSRLISESLEQSRQGEFNTSVSIPRSSTTERRKRDEAILSAEGDDS